MFEIVAITVLSCFFASVGALYRIYNPIEVMHPEPIKSNLKVNRNVPPIKKNRFLNFKYSKTVPKKPIYLVDQGYYADGKLLNSYSRDNGETWYVIPYGVLNPATFTRLEAKHPHVMMKKLAWDDLKKYVIKKGPIKLDDKKGIRLLERAGFDIISRD